ncbi:MAG: hypothetical protein ACI4F9_11100 [Lachnospiraceae bacterium]
MLACKWLFLRVCGHLANARDRGNAKHFRGALIGLSRVFSEAFSFSEADEGRFSVRHTSLPRSSLGSFFRLKEFVKEIQMLVGSKKLGWYILNMKNILSFYI